MEIRRILWPTDFSKNCNRAGPYINLLAEKHGAEVELIYVAVDLGAVGHWYGDPEQDRIERFNRREVERAQKRLDEVCRAELKDCLVAEKKAVVGDPLQEIIKTINEDNIDLVVIAARGRSADDRDDSPLGSLTKRLVKRSPVPVLVVNTAHPAG